MEPVRKSLLEIIPALRFAAGLYVRLLERPDEDANEARRDGRQLCQIPATGLGAMGYQSVLSFALSGLCQALLLLMLVLPMQAAPALAALPQGNAVTDPQALLRDALPMRQADLRALQHRLEATSDDLRAKRWSALASSSRRAEAQLATRRAAILASYSETDRPAVEALLDDLSGQLQLLSAAADAQQREAFLEARRAALSAIGTAEALLVGPFPFAIPDAYASLPRLLGRATVLLRTTKGDLTAVVDGYNAPLTAGAFVDLVRRGFYDGLPFIRAEDFYVLQTGDPKGPETGFIDPASKTERHVPLEIRVPEIGRAHV